MLSGRQRPTLQIAIGERLEHAWVIKWVRAAVRQRPILTDIVEMSPPRLGTAFAENEIPPRHQIEFKFHAIRRRGTGLYYRWPLCGATDFNGIDPKAVASSQHGSLLRRLEIFANEFS